MTTTSAGPHGFHLKPVLQVLAAVTLLAATAVVITQQIGGETPPAPAEIATEVAVSAATGNGLAQALADGKFDAGLVPPPIQPVAEAVPAPLLVPITGQGGLHDALIDGKFDLNHASRNPGVRYVRAPEASSGLWAAFESGQLDTGFGASEPAPPSSPTWGTPTISGGHQQ